MGVDFISCAECSYNFPDCGTFAHCGGCGNYFCNLCMQKYCILGEDLEEEDMDEKSTCPFCTLVLIDTADLLEFALEKLGKTKEELESDYRAVNG